eukprot:29255-Pelagococcus_subviridis.AAC.10
MSTLKYSRSIGAFSTRSAATAFAAAASSPALAPSPSSFSASSAIRTISASGAGLDNARLGCLRPVLHQPQRLVRVRGTDQGEFPDDRGEPLVRARGDIAPELAHGRELGRLPVGNRARRRRRRRLRSRLRARGVNLFLLLFAPQRALFVVELHSGRAAGARVHVAETALARAPPGLVQPRGRIRAGGGARGGVAGDESLHAASREPRVCPHELARLVRGLVPRPGLRAFTSALAVGVVVVAVVRTPRPGQERLRLRLRVRRRRGVVDALPPSDHGPHAERPRRVRPPQNPLHRPLHLVDELVLMQEVHLAFRRMHVDVHRPRRQRQRRVHERFLRLWQDRGVHSLDRALQPRALDETVVDEEHERGLFRVVARARDQRVERESKTAGAGAWHADVQTQRRELLRDRGAVHRAQTVHALGRDRTVQRRSRLAELSNHERRRRPRRRVPLDDVHDPVVLLRRRSQRFPSRRDVVEQVLDRDRRALHARARHRGAVLEDAVAVRRLQRVRRVFRHRRHREVGHERHGRERLASKPERRDLVQVLERRELRRRVPLAQDGEVVLADADAVVRDLKELASAVLDGDRDRGRARVERVLQELLERGGRAVDDLARGDAVDDVLREASDRARFVRGRHRDRQRASIWPRLAREIRISRVQWLSLSSR